LKNANKVLTGKSEQKKPLGRARNNWQHDDKTYLKAIVGEDVMWSKPDQARVQCQAHVNTVMNLLVP
jgi:hypothetical protein